MTLARETYWWNESVGRRLTKLIHKGRAKKIKELIKFYGLVYLPGWEIGYNFLCEALKHKQTNVAKVLLRSGLEVSSAEKDFFYDPLRLAIENGDVVVIKMIL